MCAGAEARFAALTTQPRIFARLSKSPAVGGASTEDETAEVASPAQESTDQLCAGYSGHAWRIASVSISPRKAATRPGRQQQHLPALPHQRRLQTQRPQCQLGRQLQRERHRCLLCQRVQELFASRAKRNLGGQAAGPRLHSAQGRLAPRRAARRQRRHLPPDRRHLYKDSPQQKNGLYFDVQTFGLVGLHIIQRVHAGPPGGSPEGAGGTYIFATWEHQSVGNGAAYSYVNYSKFATNTEMPYPNTAAGLQVARLQNYPLPTTANLNAKVQSQLAGSVWANYRLIGTQFQAIDLGNSAMQAQKGVNASLALGQPPYLANLLIETNRGLQQFQGQPPGQTPNPISAATACRSTTSSSPPSPPT